MSSRRRTYQLILTLLFLSFLLSAGAQQPNMDNRRRVIIHNRLDTFTLSAFTIVPHTVHIKAIGPMTNPDQEDYHIDNQRFIWDPQSNIRSGDDSLSFSVSFRVLPYDLSRWSTRFDSSLYQDGSMRVMEPIEIQRGDNSPLISERGIQYDGTFTRGLSLGNRQDLVLNSNFDLRMSGEIGEGIEVLAALSDNSIPLQPEGNTQQLQEFDKIFIQLSKQGNTLIGGDFNLNRPTSYFMNYFKRNQGVKVESNAILKPGQRLSTHASIAGTRGKFARINLKTQEGNQGPYRLPGVEGERFIIILAGSERIYLDGNLLVRGQQQDYVIDYNAGELTFTANRIITKDVRIIAEYEYSDQNYNRSIFTFGTNYQTKRLELQFHAYSEQDGKLSSGLNTLTAEDKRILADLGDSLRSAASPSIRLRPEGFDPNIVMYKLVDTLGYSGILVRSTNPDNAKYTAKFTRVGAGKGDYVRISEEANGVVYAWIAPDSLTGASLGDFAPISQLVAPQQQQMFASSASYRVGRRGQVSTELSMSRLDLNRFSERDSDDDLGYAMKTSYHNEHHFTRDTSKPALRLITDIHHEYLTSQFKTLKPYRTQEFSRDWNIGLLDRGAEHYTQAKAALLGKSFELEHSYHRFFRQDIYEGNRNTTTITARKGGFAILGIWNALNSSDPTINSNFRRPKFDISQRLGKEKLWKIGFYFEEERNEARSKLDDTLVLTSFYYDLGRFYLQRSAGEKLDLEMSYQKRADYTPSTDEFRIASLADDVALRAKWQEGNLSTLDATFTIRDLEIKIPSAINSEGGLNYVGRLNHQFNLGRGALRTTTTYEVSSGQEPKRTFQYLKVDPGQGIYTWLDLNEDGIQQINEFEIAPFQELAEYIRVTVLTNEFIATNNVLLNQSYALDLRRVAKNKKAWWARFSDQGSIRIDRKNLEAANVSLWNPFTLNIADSSLVSVNAQIRNVLYFNRSNPAYDIQYEWNDFRNRFVLITGYESKRLRRHILRSRFNLSRIVSGLMSLTYEENNQDSERFDNKDFNIQSWELKPEVTFQPTGKFRLLANYRFAKRDNLVGESNEQAVIHDLRLESTFNTVSKSSLRAEASLVIIDFTGQRNSALEFAMLEGLKNGTNWLWSLSYDRKLVNNIRINLSYNGRKSGLAKVVHTARAQVSAFF